MIWPFIVLSYFSLFVFGLTDNIRGPLFPEILHGFGVSDSLGSLMFALSSVSGVISSYLARHLLRRYDRLSVLKGALLALIVVLIGLATAPYFWIFLFFSLCFGLCLGIVGLVPNILVPLGSSAQRKQQMLAGLHSMYGVASLLSPLLAASVEYLTGSWRWTFACATIAPLALLLYCFHSSHDNLHVKSTHSADFHKTNKIKNMKPQIFLALMVSFCVAAEIMVSSRLALFMRRTWNYDMESSSLYVTYFFVAMLTGRFLFTMLKLKTSIRNQLSAALILSCAFIFAGIYIHPIFLALMGFTVAPFYPLAISWISSIFPHDLDTAVSYMMATDSLMLVVMHLSVGKVTDMASISTAMLIFGPIFCVMSLFFVNGFYVFFKDYDRH